MIKTLHREIGYGQQDVDYTEILQLEAHKLRIRIRSNSFRFQSFARIERWDGAKWEPLGEVHYSRMTTEGPYAYRERSIPFSTFERDRMALIAQARVVLDVHPTLPATKATEVAYPFPDFETWRESGVTYDDPVAFERETGVDNNGGTGRYYDGGGYILRCERDGAKFWDLPLANEEFECASLYPLECALYLYMYQEHGGRI